METEKPQKIIAKVSERYFLDEGKKFLLVKMELVEPKRVKFQAGQYLSIKINDKGERRSYSIASTPDIDHAVEIIVDLAPKGEGSQYIENLKLGEEVEMLAPLGRFIVQDQGEDKLLFIATGSGIVPMMAMIKDLLINKREKRQIRLHWGLRYEKDLFWLDNLERLTEEYDNFVFDLVLSKPNDGWGLCWGHVQDCLTRDIKDISGWEVYLCGGKQMIEEVSELLESKGMSEDNIHYEKFY